MDTTIKQSLKEIVGEENFTDSLIDLIAYSKDSSEHHHRPDAALWPVNTEQISAIMKLANIEKFPIVPRGAGTSLAGLAVPEKGGIILDLGRMDKIIDVNIKDRVVVVQPGVVYADLDRALVPYGFFFPPIRPAVRLVLWEAMWPPTPGASKEPNTAQQRTMYWL